MARRLKLFFEILFLRLNIHFSDISDVKKHAPFFLEGAFILNNSNGCLTSEASKTSSYF